MKVRRALLVLAVLALVGVSGVIGGYLNYRPSPDEVDRAQRARIDVGWSHRYVHEGSSGKPVLLEKFFGDAVYDLRAVSEDADIRIEHGFGDVTIIAPVGVGVRIFGRHDGIGEWETPGYRVDGEYLVNDSYGESDVTIDMLLFRGLGRVHVIEAEAVASR